MTSSYGSPCRASSLFGFEARAFSSAEDFLGLGSLAKTECLILDMAMPGMTGLELQQELARREHRIPIVFITAQTDEKLGPQAIRAGATACLLKPFSELAIRTAVNAALLKDEGPWAIWNGRCKMMACTMEGSAKMPDAKPIVFVVDDDVSVRESLDALIQVAGWERVCTISPAPFSPVHRFGYRAASS